MIHKFRVEPFDLRLCVTCGQTFRWSLAEGVWNGVDGDAWFQVSPDWTVESNLPDARFRRLFRLDEDLNATCTEILERAPELGPYLASNSGLRMINATDPNEVLFSFLCTANNHVARITPMVQKLATYGEKFLGTDFFRFPSSIRIGEIEERELRLQGFGYRAKSIPEVARQLVDRGAGWLDGLRSSSYEVARKELLRLPSVGPKLADCIALFGLGFGEAVPVDTHIWQLACKLYFPEWAGVAITGKRYDAVAETLRGRLGSLSGMAHQYLFVDNLQNWRQRKRG